MSFNQAFTLDPISRAKIVARCYLKHWQLSEGEEYLYKRANSNKDISEEVDQVKKILKQTIIDLGYPSPDDVVYDNESVPCISWPEDFDCDEFYADLLDELL